MHEGVIRPRVLLLVLTGLALTLLLLVASFGGRFGGSDRAADEPIAVAGASPQTTETPATSPAAGEPATGGPVTGGPAGDDWSGTGRSLISYGDDGISTNQGTGTISGSVSSGGLIPLAGVIVHLADGNGVLTGRAVATDASGLFLFESLPPGSYRLFFSDPAGFYLPGWYGGGNGSPVGVSTSQDTGIVFSMVRNNSPSGGIAGLVTGNGGLGLAGVEVLVYVVDLPTVVLELKATTVTAANGSYAVSGLPPGSYKVLFQPTGGYYAPQWYRDAADYEAAELIPVNTGATVGKVDGELKQGGKVAGRVMDDGKPVSFALVDIFDHTGVIVDSAVTDAQGYYQSEPLPAGFYRVRAAASGYAGRWYGGDSDSDSATPVQVFAGETTGGVDILLIPPISLHAATGDVQAVGESGAPAPAAGAPGGGPDSALPESQPVESLPAGQAQEGGLAGDDEE